MTLPLHTFLIFSLCSWYFLRGGVFRLNKIINLCTYLSLQTLNGSLGCDRCSNSYSFPKNKETRDAKMTKNFKAFLVPRLGGRLADIESSRSWDRYF